MWRKYNFLLSLFIFIVNKTQVTYNEIIKLIILSVDIQLYGHSYSMGIHILIIL